MDDKTLDRELEALFAVDPSPAFRTKVLERVAEDTAPPVWRLQWTFAAAGAIAGAVLLVVTLRVLAPSAPPPHLAAHRIAVRPQSGPLVTASAIVERTTSPDRVVATPQSVQPVTDVVVIVDPREAAAWRLLLGGVNAGRIDPTRLARAESTLPAEMSDEFVFPPVIIQPLTPAVSDQGVQP